MKPLILASLLLASCPVMAASPVGPEAAALKFNQWYISQLIQDKNPLTDYSGLNPYVTTSTIAAIKNIYSADSNEIDVPDADMFIKAQDFGSDWQQVSVISSEYDPVCTQIYVAFGAKQEHTVIDCMVMENGKWKVQSVAGQKISRNINIK